MHHEKYRGPDDLQHSEQDYPDEKLGEKRRNLILAGHVVCRDFLNRIVFVVPKRVVRVVAKRHHD